jgi:hypothetical protein
MVSAPSLGYELALLLKRLREFYVGSDHEFLRLNDTNKCRRLDFVTGKIEIESGLANEFQIGTQAQEFTDFQ